MYSRTSLRRNYPEYCCNRIGCAKHGVNKASISLRYVRLLTVFVHQIRFAKRSDLNVKPDKGEVNFQL